MTDRQENYLTMSKAVQKALTTNAAVVNAIPAFLKNSKLLDTSVATIDGLVQVQTKNITGTTEDKQQAKDAEIAKAVELAGATKSYAGDTNNNTLLESVNYSTSDLKRMRDTVLADTLLQIRDTVQANLGALADYGVKPEDVDALTASIAVYTTLLSAPRGAINVRSAATKKMESEFVNLKGIMERLDGFADRLKSSNADFYNTYYSARVVVDNKGGGGKEDGKAEV